MRNALEVATKTKARPQQRTNNSNWWKRQNRSEARDRLKHLRMTSDKQRLMKNKPRSVESPERICLRCLWPYLETPEGSLKLVTNKAIAEHQKRTRANYVVILYTSTFLGLYESFHFGKCLETGLTLKSTSYHLFDKEDLSMCAWPSTVLFFLPYISSF